MAASQQMRSRGRPVVRRTEAVSPGPAKPMPTRMPVAPGRRASVHQPAPSKTTTSFAASGRTFPPDQARHDERHPFWPAPALVISRDHAAPAGAGTPAGLAPARPREVAPAAQESIQPAIDICASPTETSGVPTGMKHPASASIPQHPFIRARLARNRTTAQKHRSVRSPTCHNPIPSRPQRRTTLVRGSAQRGELVDAMAGGPRKRLTGPIGRVHRAPSLTTENSVVSSPSRA